MDIDARPSKETLEFFSKVDPWVERVIYNEDDKRECIFQNDTPRKIFDLLEEIALRLDFEFRYYENENDTTLKIAGAEAIT